MMNDATSGAFRPSRPPLTSSSLPDSSSDLVWRIMTITISTAMAAAMNAVYLIIDREPIEVGS